MLLSKAFQSKASNWNSTKAVPRSSFSSSISKRNASQATVVRYTAFGAPENVLKVEKENLPALKDNQILVKMLAAPINPADLNMVEGVYGTKPSLPSVGGNEGVGVIVDVGKNVRKLNKQDHVIPVRAGLGTWRSHGVFSEDDLLSVPKDIPVEYAATISVNPCTGYRLLQDFVKLKEGDVVIQNGANSMVGTAVIQLAAAKGIKTINIIRNRAGYTENTARLKALGGYLVVSEDYAATSQFSRLISDLPKPKLGLNCVGGSSATEILRNLAEGGTMVTYGGMSKKPVTVPTGALIFKDVQLRGFWLTRWTQNAANTEARKQMLNELFELIRKDKLKFWMETVKFSNFSHGLQRAQSAEKDRKIVLLLDQ